MNLRFTLAAARQIEQALDAVGVHSPQGAIHIQRRIVAVMDVLVQFPFAGRATTRQSIRRIAVALPLPDRLPGDGW